MTDLASFGERLQVTEHAKGRMGMRFVVKLDGVVLARGRDRDGATRRAIERLRQAKIDPTTLVSELRVRLATVQTLAG